LTQSFAKFINTATKKATLKVGHSLFFETESIALVWDTPEEHQSGDSGFFFVDTPPLDDHGIGGMTIITDWLEA
jgi:hypothetical protein